MKTTLSRGFGVGTIYPSVGSRWATSLAKYLASRSWVMSSEVMFEPIQEPDGSDMIEERRRKMDGKGVLLGAAGAAVRLL